MASGRAVHESELFKLKQARDELGRFVKRVDQRSYQVVLEEAARIRAEARMQVPVASGVLRDSIQVPVKHTPSRVHMSAIASAVDNGYDYAGKQHDDTSLNHPNGGKAHFLSDPFNEGVERIEQRLEDELSFGR